jgi:predicted DNA-binding protein
MLTDCAAPERPPITARLPLDLVSRLDAQAKRLQTTRGALLRAFAARGVEDLERTAAA